MVRMPSSTAHIVGVGISGPETNPSLHECAITATTKALLDAGITYSNVDHSIACFDDTHERLRISRTTLESFGLEGSAVSEVDNHSGLFTAVQSIRSGQAECALVVGVDRVSNAGPLVGLRLTKIWQQNDQVRVIAFVLVSRLFLTSHAYLKDGAVCVRAFVLANRTHSRSSTSGNDARASKIAIRSALRQAKLGSGELQVVEVRGSEGARLRDALDNLRVGSAAAPSKSLATFTGTNGLAGLCGLGEYTVYPKTGE